MKKKPPLSSLSPEEYDARLRKLLLGALGKAWMFWPPRLEAKRRCQITDKNDVHYRWFVCEICGEHREKIEVDHITPCVKPSDGWQGFDVYINSRFVKSAAKLQNLCHECHLKKSKKENAERREAKKAAKGA